MRLLCVGRHEYLSEHLGRYFQDLGAECEPVVGAAAVAAAATRVEPHLVVCEGDLLTPALLAAWSELPAMAEVPVLAVSLTCRPEEGLSGSAGVVYLPALDREQAQALLTGALRPRGVQSPPGWRMPEPTSPAIR